jgi:hypothetical protein
VQQLEVVGHAFVQRNPIDLEVFGAGRFHHVGFRIGQNARNVGLGMLSQYFFCAGFPIHGQQGRFVAANRR